MIRKRIVVTGLGLLCSLGLNVKQAWNNLIAGKCGITRLSDVKYENVPSKVAAKIYEGFDIESLFSKSELRSTTLSGAYALKASEEAINDSNILQFSDLDKDRIGVSVGVGMVELPDIYENAKKFQDEGYKKLSPFFMPRILLNMITGNICLKYGFRGPSHCVSTACSTGLHSIGDSFYFLQNSNADLMICGACEAPINPFSIAGFCRMKALSTNFNEMPEEASRPFDAQRDGFVIGEGSAILVLETLEHVKKRNALDRIYCEVLGYGMSNDAHHVTKPSPDGYGAQLCMQQALQSAKLKPKDITYINAHATSTPIGDDIELKAIQKVFGVDYNDVFISSTKGSHGHLLGSAGSLESIFTILAIKENILPPNLNLKNPISPSANYVLDLNQVWPNDLKKVALKNSFGFGGTNATIIFTEFNQ